MSCSKRFRSIASAVLLVLVGVPASQSSELVQLTADGRLKRDPVFISDGEELVFGADEGTDKIRLLRMNLETRKVTPFHENAPRSELEPAFSPCGRYYALNHNTGNLTVKMVIHDSETGTDTDISVKGRGGMRSPAFSPDSTRIAYCFAETGPQQIFSVDVKGKDKRQLTDSQGINNWPSYTPDGKRIVFTSSRDGNYEIYAMDADGKNVTRLTNSPTQDIRPRVSPEGTRIVFTSSRDGNREIYVMNIDGTHVKRVTENPERDDYPAWHPDGKSIAFVSERKGRHDIYIIEVP